MSAYLLVLGHRDGLRWVLDHDAMAFGNHRAALARRIVPGDSLFLYTTRGCFLNPTKGRSRVIGKARTTGLARAGAPIEVAGQTFDVFLDIEIERLASYPDGVDFAETVPRLRSFAADRSWAARLRTPLLRLEPEDAVLLDDLLIDDHLEAAKQSYRRWMPGVRLRSGPGTARAGT